MLGKMRNFIRLVTLVGIVALIALLVELHDITKRIELLNLELDVYDKPLTVTREETIEEAMQYAPEGKTIYQLRGDAQKAAQDSLDRLTKLHNLPRYELTAIRFGLVLHNDVAAAVPPCEDEYGNPVENFYINVNEILFLRNYEEFIHMWIPHEVAHIFSCLNGGYTWDSNETRWEAEHGQEWEQAMKDLGFINPAGLKTHEMDMTPVYNYKRALINRLRNEVK